MGFFYNFLGRFGEQKRPCSGIVYRFINNDQLFISIEAGALNFLANASVMGERWGLCSALNHNLL
jgi:hypothetical protein